MRTKLFFTALLIFGSMAVAKAQHVDGKPINELDADYVMIYSDVGPILSSKITVRIDYGQDGRIQQITDERRRPMTFNGMIAVLNMMRRNGFELFEIIRSEKEDQQYYLMRRKNSYASDNGQTVDYDASKQKN